MSRDVVGEIIGYNLPLAKDDHRVKADGGGDLTSQALGRKLEALARSPFSFFRGTFHLMATDVLQQRAKGCERRAPSALIVGDLHLENFGVYRGANGKLVFDVNDFDDVGFGPADFDLQRLCTSALLIPGLSASVRANAAKAIAKAWADGVERIGGRFPVGTYEDDKAEEPVRSLLRGHSGKTRVEQLLKAAPDKGHKAFTLEGSPPKYARVGKSFVTMVERSLLDYLAALKDLKIEVSHTWDVLDVAYRFKGNGSLGRWRFSALLGRGDERRIVEIKEARESCLDEVLSHPAPKERARAQTASIRRMQGSAWPRVAGTHLGKVPALAREVQAEEEKLSTEAFAGKDAGDDAEAQLVSYARQCGEVTARMVCRANAPALLDDASFDAQVCARKALEFAQGYAAQVESDHKAYLKGRAEIAKALGVER